jgi:alcohol dehydrogenase class IV
MQPCVFHPPATIVFHAGALQSIGQHARTLGGVRALLVTSPGMPGRAAACTALNSLKCAGVTTVGTVMIPAEPGPPELATVFAEARSREPDLLVGLGGGSVLDSTKLLSVLLRHHVPLESLYGADRVPGPGLPIILAPTTAGSGSEVSAQAVVTDREAGTKRGVKDLRLVAACAVVDPEALRTCPPHVMAMCGMDALTHAIEAFTGRRATALSDSFALRAATLLWDALPRAAQNPAAADAADLEALALGAMLAGFAFSITGTAAVHACGYPLSARYAIPHGVANAVMLPHVLRFNREATRRIPALEDHLEVRSGELEQAVESLCVRLWLPGSLRSLGVSAKEFTALAAEIANDRRHLDANPRHADYREVLNLLHSANEPFRPHTDC